MSEKTPQPSLSFDDNEVNRLAQFVKPDFILPDPDRVQNVKVNGITDFGEMNKTQATKHNSQGVDFENKYNVLFQAEKEETKTKVMVELASGLDAEKSERERLEEKITLLEEKVASLEEALKSGKNESEVKEYAADQPRRTRNVGNGVEKSVKYADGTFGWETVGGDKLDTAKTAVLADGYYGDKKVSVFDTKNIPGTDSLALSVIDSDGNTYTIREDQLEIRNRDDSASKGEKPGKELELYQQKDLVKVSEMPKEIELVQVKDSPVEAEKQGSIEVPTKVIEAVKETEEIKDAEKVEDGEFKYEIPAELKAEWEGARDKYAELTAKHRGSLLGHFLQNSKLLVSIPGVRGLADRLNDKLDANLDAAREDYTAKLRTLQQHFADSVRAEYEDSAELENYIRITSGASLIDSEVWLESKIVEERTNRSGKASKIADWWVKQDGLGGKFKRVGVIAGVAGVGIGVGLIGGLLAVPAVGIAAGVGIGTGVGLRINKKRAGVTTEKAASFAAEQSASDLEKKRQYVANQAASGEAVEIDDLTAMTETRTGNEKEGNRIRLAGLAGAGTVAGLAGAAYGEQIRNSLDTAPATQPEVAEDTTPHAPSEAAPATPETVGNSFNIESGNGYDRELVDFANANNKQLSIEQADQLHKALVQQFGGDYIHIDGQSADTYVQNGDYRLTAPGAAEWDPGVSQYIQQWMAGNGLW